MGKKGKKQDQPGQGYSKQEGHLKGVREVGGMGGPEVAHQWPWALAMVWPRQEL